MSCRKEGETWHATGKFAPAGTGPPPDVLALGVLLKERLRPATYSRYAQGQAGQFESARRMEEGQSRGQVDEARKARRKTGEPGSQTKPPLRFSRVAHGIAGDRQGRYQRIAGGR